MTGNQYMEPNRLNEEEISLYSKGELDQKQVQAVEEILKDSKPDFHTYVSLKEAMFDTPLPKTANIDLIFRKNGKELFSVGLSLVC